MSEWRRRYMKEARDWAAQIVAGLLPRRVVYMAVIRMWAFTTRGRWSNQEVPALTVSDALQRWEEALTDE